MGGASDVTMFRKAKFDANDMQNHAATTSRGEGCWCFYFCNISQVFWFHMFISDLHKLSHHCFISTQLFKLFISSHQIHIQMLFESHSDSGDSAVLHRCDLYTDTDSLVRKRVICGITDDRMKSRDGRQVRV